MGLGGFKVLQMGFDGSIGSTGVCHPWFLGYVIKLSGGSIWFKKGYRGLQVFLRVSGRFQRSFLEVSGMLIAKLTVVV